MAQNGDVKRDALGKFVPGTGGGPGRKKGARRLTDDLYRILGEEATGDELDAMCKEANIPEALRAQIDLAANRQEAFARMLVWKMLTGSWRALEEIEGRLDPRPKAVELSGPGGGPIRSEGLQLTGAIDPADAGAAYHGLVRGEPDED